MLLPFLIAAVGGYLLGSLPFGYLVARARGVDIFKAGSGNPGATNVKRVLGAKAGNLVYLLDALKGAVAAGWPLVYILLSPGASALATPGPGGHSLWTIDWSLAAAVTGLAAAVLGHSFSCFTRFRGGKGVATASGGLLVLMPVPIMIGGAVWFATFLASRYVSLASIFSSIAVPAAAWAFGLPLGLNIVVSMLGVLLIARHRSNIRRLLAGTEHRWERRPKEDAT
ncbi:MAG TPA: glycerol-3-phosphate 1-O-acyltransferase PlsY [Opitutaceae bacterium]|nr:glycerol-3-phosphate 1-O-acyltransferase PlsY [Opitutaceae bacterium]